MKPNDLNTFVLHIYHTGLCSTHDLGISKMYKWTPDNRIFRVLKIGLISCSHFPVDNFFYIYASYSGYYVCVSNTSDPFMLYKRKAWLPGIYHINHAQLYYATKQPRHATPAPSTHWGRDEIDAISQTLFSIIFSWMKIHEFRSKCQWSLSLRV